MTDVIRPIERTLRHWTLMMCEDIYAKFKCHEKHEEAGEDGTKKKHILKCVQGTQATCAVRTSVHDTSEDDLENECPECKGETPPETP